MTSCLFCRSHGPFSTVEHIIPESLGNDELLLHQEVCDSCQAYFGKEIERLVLAKSPLAFWRTFLRVRTKKGKLPTVDLSTPSRSKGVIQATHPVHDNLVGFTAHEDGSTSVDIDDPRIVEGVLTGSRGAFTFVLTPKLLHALGRFLLKVGIELVAGADPKEARAPRYDDARSHARFGTGDRLWPLFHFSSGDLKDLRRVETDENGMLERVECYTYALLAVGEYHLLHFAMGTDHWVVSLSHRYPDPQIKAAFPDKTLELLWYPDVA